MEFWKVVRQQVLTNQITQRAACRKSSLGWRTLKKILAHAEPPGYRKNRPRPKPKLDPFLPVIQQILEAGRSAVDYRLERLRVAGNSILICREVFPRSLLEPDDRTVEFLVPRVREPDNVRPERAHRHGQLDFRVVQNRSGSLQERRSRLMEAVQPVALCAGPRASADVPPFDRIRRPTF